MASQGHHHELHVGKFQPTQALKTAAVGGAALGLIVFAVGLMRDPARVWPAYLTAFFYFSCLGLGGMFWVAINHLTKAGWSVSIRRYAEGMTSFVPMILLGGLVLVAGMKYLYPWADPAQAMDPLIAAKAPYLNVKFFIIRLFVFCGGWLLFKHFIVGGSIQQDSNGDHAITLKNVGRSIAFVVFFALSFSLFSVDLLMSILPSWYSTIFGIYCFAGLFQSSLAVLCLIIIFMKRNGFVKGYVTTEHLHDVVKYMKGFTVFWAYIAFSQFMLIWYANIPEETEYYIMRSLNGWLPISLGLLVFRFIVPFIALLPRGWKRNENHVVMVAALILIMQYVDIWWMVYPNFFDGHRTFGLYEIGLFALFAGVFLLTMIRFFTKNSVVAIKDPRMHEALEHHVMY